MTTAEDASFVDFVNTNSGVLLRTAGLFTGDRGRAEDLLQTALTKAYLHWPKLREPAAARAYVRKIMANTATSWWRLRSYGERPTEVLPEVAAPDPTAARDDRLTVWRHLRGLPPRQRVVLVLRYYEDLSEAEIADTLGISRGAVKSAASRALQRLRGEMTGYALEEVH
jgi:RNA polymerase sigma-70 factor (sigma-E family)